MTPMLDVHQVAAIMRIHHKKVQRLARTGVLPCIKVGAVYRFRAAALEAWMETHEVSERKSTQAGPVVGVSVSGLSGSAEAENFKHRLVSYYGGSKGGPTELDL